MKGASADLLINRVREFRSIGLLFSTDGECSKTQSFEWVPSSKTTESESGADKTSACHTLQ